MYKFDALNNLMAVSDNPVADTIWTALSSQIAILIYVVVLLLAVVILVVAVVFDHGRRAEETEELDKLRDYVEKVNNGKPVTATSSTASTTAVGASADEKEKDSEEHPSRFYMLTETDRIMRNKPQGGFDEEITMKEFCERFRNFAASRLKSISLKPLMLFSMST